ncbi:UDP-N-acetylmuramoyl-L-alanine--D-glutamate ligase [Plectonema cf. radiosum LEGE 06105]|uniref:UDP-N-acetylmuramoylalanine--D-glutamate ligase n=1 Tax=Plectonema cf. radiosum LEGE 06105 TaxID=945769 RepID=A0A8J7F149_9CYAN|nr:UDP-N-acetylmuramoyl-L-alanine--D-glutamate ligase [Plectonema radiosum]MBE9214131.1 UDP-N-acetylmuramoyl-L-alanine--D-glutamate ligase [Plectonema cf. radiosum LEGE 06105]
MPKAHVIGLGKSGVAAARLLNREGWEVEIGDTNTSPNLLQQQQELAVEGITVKLGYSLELNDTELPKLIVVSPGVPWDIPVLIKAREKGIDTIGEMEFAWRNLRSIPWVAVTGTNGKTTVTSLIGAIFQTAGFHAPTCGNIGHAACEIALEEKQGDKEETFSRRLDWIIAELSSYQIESSTSISPKIGIWTTLTPDHLARHKTVQNYYNIKAQLLRSSQMQIFNGDDPYLRKMGETDWQDAYWTSIKGKDKLITGKGFYIQDGWVVETQHIASLQEDQKIMPVSALRMVGEHNLQNLLLSIAAARLAGIDKEAIHQAISEFAGVPHRLEHIRSYEGIDFINDSKATNYDAAEVGLASVKSPVILIAGGAAKAGEDKPWINKIKEKAAAVLLIGDAAPMFAKRLEEEGYSNYEDVGTMQKAVTHGFKLAKHHDATVVLLSPACASFDQYANFEVRGDDFRKWCLEL